MLRLFGKLVNIQYGIPDQLQQTYHNQIQHFYLPIASVCFFNQNIYAQIRKANIRGQVMGTGIRDAVMIFFLKKKGTQDNTPQYQQP